MSTIGTLHAVPARGLPQPTSDRFQLLRAGIRNVWEYDHQEFWLSGGWLVLRGPNAAGKSKALELLLPFVLDGETRPERLDPFGSRAKTMYWNLIEYDPDRRSEIGYCWLEFGRVDAGGQQHFVTCIVGMRGLRGTKGVECWFAVTSLRIGSGLELVGVDGRLLAPDRLRQAVEGHGRYTTNPRDHRSAVDQSLFGLGQERFEALLHLLLQLRRPKLSEKLEFTKLAGILSDALPPLERGRLELLAQGFARLDAEASELEVLERARTELGVFLDAYRAYARVQTRLRADAVTTAASRFDDVTRTERLQRQVLEQAGAELAEVEGRRASLDLEVARLGGQLTGLDLSKVQHLDLVEGRATEAERAAKGIVARAADDERFASDAEAERARTLGLAEEAAARRDRLVGRLDEVGVQVGLAEVIEAHRGQLFSDPRAARRGLEAAADRRTVLVREVLDAADAQRRAQEQAQAADDRAEEAERARQNAEAVLIAAKERSEEAGSAYAGAVEGWAGSLAPGVRDRLVVPSGLGARALDAVLAAGADDTSARQLGRELCAPAREALGAERAQALAEVRRLEGEQRALAERREAIAAERDDAPAPVPGRPGVRPPGCAGLWRCVEFEPSLAPAEQAALEAALEASGLLDALVTPDGRLLDPDSFDTVVGGGAVSGPALSWWLIPDAAAPVPAQAVAAALAAVGAGPVPGAVAWVGVDGRWANGALSGRWSKAAPEFVGASARATARARRIEEIDRQLAILRIALHAAEGAAASLAALERDLGEAERAFPSPTRLRDALREVTHAQGALGLAGAELARALQALQSARARLDAATVVLGHAETAAGCLAAAADDVLEALRNWLGVLVEAVVEVEGAAHQWANAEASDTRARARQGVAEASASEASTAMEEAERRRGEADELRATVGADVKAILARKTEIESALHTAHVQLDELERTRDAVRDRLKEAQTKLAATEEERERRERERAERLGGLAVLSGTELCSLALGPIDADRDLTQVTAGLAFARSARERLGQVPTDQRTQDQAANRLHGSFTDLRARLGADFDPHLDSQEGASLCYAKLNGVTVGAVDLAAALDEQIRRRRETLSAEERDIIERHLLAEVGNHIGDRVHAAWTHQRRMNDQLARHGTRSGVTLYLEWEANPAIGAGAAEALELLRNDVSLLDAWQRATLAAFLADRVRSAREEAEGADAVDRMAEALDYRRWHRFRLIRKTRGAEEDFKSLSQGRGSGGEQAKLAHLPLFAATAAYYASAAPTCPRPIVLDEAFAGIDEDQRADCMGMLVDLGLDLVLTNFGEWGCYPQVPAVAIYHLERTEGERGVAALRFVWNGRSLDEDDPFLDSLEPPLEGLFADLPDLSPGTVARDGTEGL